MSSGGYLPSYEAVTDKVVLSAIFSTYVEYTKRIILLFTPVLVKVVDIC